MWQDIEDEAWEYMNQGQHALARQRALKAIDLEPNAIDCYVILGQASEVLGEKIAFAREAVRLGEVLWADQLALPDPSDYPFWGRIETRPYMRGLHTLALALWHDQRTGAQQEAIQVAQHALNICPNDNIGFRFLLLEWFARHEQWKEGYALASVCAEEPRTELKLWGALYHFQADLDLEQAKAYVEEALKINPNAVRPLLRKNAPKKSNALMVAHASLEEAEAYASVSHDIWHSVSGAIEWLKGLP